MNATKFPKKIVRGNVTDTALYISANGNIAETSNVDNIFFFHVSRRNRFAEMRRKFELSSFRKFSAIRKRLTSPCVILKLFSTRIGDKKAAPIHEWSKKLSEFRDNMRLGENYAAMQSTTKVELSSFHELKYPRNARGNFNFSARNGTF